MNTPASDLQEMMAQYTPSWYLGGSEYSSYFKRTTRHERHRYKHQLYATKTSEQYFQHEGFMINYDLKHHQEIDKHKVRQYLSIASAEIKITPNLEIQAVTLSGPEHEERVSFDDIDPKEKSHTPYLERAVELFIGIHRKRVATTPNSAFLLLYTKEEQSTMARNDPQYRTWISIPQMNLGVITTTTHLEADIPLLQEKLARTVGKEQARVELQARLANYVMRNGFQHDPASAMELITAMGRSK